MVGSKPCSCCWQKTFVPALGIAQHFPFCHSAGWKPLGEGFLYKGLESSVVTLVPLCRKGSRTPHLQGFWGFCKASPTAEGHGGPSVKILSRIIPKFFSGMCNEELDPTALTLRLLKWVRALRFYFLFLLSYIAFHGNVIGSVAGDPWSGIQNRENIPRLEISWQ